jgi:hypothetical protein
VYWKPTRSDSLGDTEAENNITFYLQNKGFEDAGWFRI